MALDVLGKGSRAGRESWCLGEKFLEGVPAGFSHPWRHLVAVCAIFDSMGDPKAAEAVIVATKDSSCWAMDRQKLGAASVAVPKESSSGHHDVPADPGLCMVPALDAISQDVITDAVFHGFPSSGCCSETVMLEYAFHACDLEGTGEVSASRILEYLQCVTGQSREGEGLRSLYRRLDPDESGVSVDLQTFHAVMGQWIVERRTYERAKDGDSGLQNTGPPQPGKRTAPITAQLEGYGGDTQKFGLGEAADLVSTIEDLEYANRKLVVENTKLQRSIEVLEEAAARLTEEISNLRSKLKASQQALQHAKTTASELEELKTVVKSLEEKNCQLHAQSRQLEKEQQCLSNQVQDLQEMNEKLLAERQRARHKIDELVAETNELQHHLSDCESSIVHKDVLLRQNVNQAEELKETLEEYEEMIKELKAEIIQLQKQLSQTTTDILKFPEAPLGNASAFTMRAAQSVHLEIEEIEKGRDTEAKLISPLCGTLPRPGGATASALEEEVLSPWEEVSDLGPSQDTAELVMQLLQGTEDLLHQVKRLTGAVNVLDKTVDMVEVQGLACGLEKAGEALLHRFECVEHCRATWESHLHKKVQLQTYRHQEQQWPSPDTRNSAGEEEQTDRQGRLELNQSSGVETWRDREGDGGLDLSYEKVAYPTCSSVEFLNPAARKRTEISRQDLSLLPVKNQLVLFSRSQADSACQLWLCLVRSAPMLGVLLLLTTYLLLSSLLSADGVGIWTTVRAAIGPHIQLHYLKPPPM